MEKRAEMNLILAIVKRAQRMGIAQATQLTQFIDMDNANIQFHLRLEEMLAGPDPDFAHDFTGIQNNMNRTTCRVENLFVPRYAGVQ